MRIAHSIPIGFIGSRAVRLGICLVLLVPALQGQTERIQATSTVSAEPPGYDIVSIKPSKDPRSGNVDISTNDDLFSARDVSLKTLLAHAYTIDRDHIYGLPKWALSAHYDVQAKMLNPDRSALHNLTREQWGALLEPMLADRFGLKAHSEKRVLPVYELVVAKDGSKLKPAGNHVGPTGIGTHNQHMTAVASSMDSLASELSFFVHRTVIDRTGLSGNYDFTCNWASPYPGHGSEEESDASLFTALQEQLGLKLRATKAPVVTLMVDHVDQPASD